MTWTIKRTDTFHKNYKKLPTRIQNKFKEVFVLFVEDPFTKSLNTHKLKGTFSVYYSSSVTHEYRFLSLINFENQEITLVNIGTHQIYK